MVTPERKKLRQLRPPHAGRHDAARPGRLPLQPPLSETCPTPAGESRQEAVDATPSRTETPSAPPATGRRAWFSTHGRRPRTIARADNRASARQRSNQVVLTQPPLARRGQKPQKRQSTRYAHHSQNDQTSHFYFPSFLFVKIRPSNSNIAATLPLRT